MTVPLGGDSNVIAGILAGEAGPGVPQQAVLNVAMNRAAIDYGGYGTTVYDQLTAPVQFSAYPYHLGTPDQSTYDLIDAASNGTLGNVVPDATNYANPNDTQAAWVQNYVAGGQGVDIGGNVYWGQNGSSPGYDPSQAYNGANGSVSYLPDQNNPYGSLDTGAFSNSDGSGSAFGLSGGNYPGQPVGQGGQQNISGLVGKDQGLQSALGQNVSPSALPNVASNNEWNSPGPPVEITNISGAGSQGLSQVSSATQSAAKYVGQSVQTAGQDIKTTGQSAVVAGTNWITSLEQSSANLMIRFGFILVGIVLLFGAWAFLGTENHGSPAAS